MGLIEYKLGQLIELTQNVNSKLEFKENDVMGMTIYKEIIPTKANTVGADLSNYLIVNPNEFVYNPRTHGKKIGLGFNDSQKSFLISWNNIAFKIQEEAKNIILPGYLFMYFNREEWDRMACFSSWGSSTEVFAWNTLCDMNLDLPPIPVQRKAVNAYNALKANLAAYTDGLDDLKLTYDVELDDLKRKSPRINLGSIFNEIDIRNKNSDIKNVLGININKTFIPSVANLAETDISKYKVIEKGQFAYSAMQTGRDETIRVALYDLDEKAVISPAYSVLQIKDENVLPEYLMAWFKRDESDRYGWFLSDGSVRASLDIPRFFEIKIPIPSIEIQKSIVAIYNAQAERQQIAERLNTILKDICPVLIRQSLEEISS